MSQDKIDYHQRRDLILDFISKHLGSNKQTVVDYFDPTERKSSPADVDVSEINISKKTIYEIIKQLVSEGLVIEKRLRSNSRDIELFTDTENLLISIPRELDEFEANYFKLLDIIKGRFSAETFEGERRSTNNAILLLTHVFSFFIDILRAYLIRAIISWSNRSSRDEHVLSRLYTTLFHRFAKMQLRLASESYDSLFMFKTTSILESMISRPPTGLSDKQSVLTLCKQFHIPNEAVEPIFDTLLRVNQSGLVPLGLKEKIKDYNPAQREAFYLMLERGRRNAITNLYGGCETCYQYSITFPQFFKTANVLDDSQGEEFEKVKEEFIKHMNEYHKAELGEQRRRKEREQEKQKS